MSDNNIPESILPYLNAIAERLWSGRAAVMVGAGFSKNACKEYPDWNELGDLFFEKAHAQPLNPFKVKYLNVMSLAEEVEAIIGRPALDNLIRTNIPDDSIQPSNLHKELLELEWVDVFTTNYDTLLEKSSNEVIKRRYETVVDIADIAYAKKPRIIKLHGSFPSERPFIITEEDFRCYMNDFAPFVNTVQQSLLENTFCLIGFSGDDPNFLQWIGWIRDHLGRENAQKIYLIGSFNFSSAKLHLLAHKGITVVDFSCVDELEKNDHKKALELFFRFLKEKKPASLDWPAHEDPGTIFPESTSISTFQKISDVWKKQRLEYPGWIILPYSNREILWNYTQFWVKHFPKTEDFDSDVEVHYISEMIWRLDRCLIPISSFDINNETCELVKRCENILVFYWKFYQNRYLKENTLINKWSSIRENWLLIALSLLRYYREKGNKEKWIDLEEKVNTQIEYLSTDQKEFFYYERILFSLFTFNIPKTIQLLENWKIEISQPYWLAKHTAFLAEAGYLDTIEDKIQKSLIVTRKKFRKSLSTNDYENLSQEAYQMVILKYIYQVCSINSDKPASIDEIEKIKRHLKFVWEKKGRNEFIANIISINNNVKPNESSNFESDWNDLYQNRNNERKKEWNYRLQKVRNDTFDEKLQFQNMRWDNLKSFRCDPWIEIKLFEAYLSNPKTPHNISFKKHEFDIGRISYSFHSENYDQDMFIATSFLRFIEDAGIPFKIGNASFIEKSVIESSNRIAHDLPFWATATIFRLGDSKGIETQFNRESVSGISKSEADKQIRIYLDALEYPLNEIKSYASFKESNFYIKLVNVLPEIISRLCSKCSLKTKKGILSFVKDVYSSSEKTKFKNIGNLTLRLITSLSIKEQYKLIPEFLQIPYPNVIHPLEKREFQNPLLFLTKKHKNWGLKLPQELMDKLFVLAVNASKIEEGNWYRSSLIRIHDLGLLSSSQAEKLGNFIWNEKENGLPDNSDFFKFIYLRLPHPSNIDPAKFFKEYVKKTPFPIQKNQKGKGVSITGGYVPLANEIIGANAFDSNFWTKEDVIEILKRLKEWWDTDKVFLEGADTDPNNFFSEAEEMRKRLSNIKKIFTKVIAPKLDQVIADELKNIIERMFEEMKQKNINVIEAEASSIHIFPEKQSIVFTNIKASLSSNDEEKIIDGLNAISIMIFKKGISKILNIEHIPRKLLEDFIIWSPLEYIHHAYKLLSKANQELSNILTKDFEVILLKRLGKTLDDTDYNKTDAEISIEQKLLIRQYSVILSAKLWKHYKSKKMTIPEVVQDWKKASSSPYDFAEIRNAWLDNV